ncbi:MULTISPECIES: carboxymuconolactone decarboxylase family protein [Niastella]|uniref:Carboxymuconolactone decarboxylase family protein n=1 Tax=Niastella soli TaxID=2821487 RepID=A0ABS3YVG6_9BACT|nr:carboxymuconolactone decarboxylase family protein [Niastella soli]MBO9201916.1 carboxymuconolactone decarboxylase family protein [Niastella soli]
MSKRIVIQALQPKAYEAMFGLEKYLSQSKIEPILHELIKIRVSQINGCAYCIDLHTKDARKHGETEQRIYGLNAWRETPFYNETERAVLALAEEITHISVHGVADQTYNNALEQLGEEKLAQVIMAIITINAWNRIGVSTHMMPSLD